MGVPIQDVHSFVKKLKFYCSYNTCFDFKSLTFKMQQFWTKNKENIKYCFLHYKLAGF